MRASSTAIIPPRLCPTTTGLLDPDRRAEPREVVGEVRDRVAVLGAVALTAPAQVERRDGVRPREVVELRLERSVVAAPAGDEEQLRLAAPGRS